MLCRTWSFGLHCSLECVCRTFSPIEAPLTDPRAWRRLHQTRGVRDRRVCTLTYPGTDSCRRVERPCTGYSLPFPSLPIGTLETASRGIWHCTIARIRNPRRMMNICLPPQVHLGLEISMCICVFLSFCYIYLHVEKV